MKISLIIPVFNAASTLPILVETLEKVLEVTPEYEIVLINDCSPDDNSSDVCLRLALANVRIKFIDLACNFGEHNAVMAGLNACTGDVAVILDDDFQNPPEEIFKLVDGILGGYDVVFARYEKKEHGHWRNLGSRFNNLVATTLLKKPGDLYLSSFKAINRFVIDEVTRYKGPYPYLDGLILRVTRRYTTVIVEHDPRRAGKSGYTLVKLISLWLRLFTSFSIIPLRLAMVTGFIFAGAGLLAVLLFIAQKLSNPATPAGWTSIMVVLLISSGIQMILIGLVGEYLGRVFLNLNGKPQFVVRRRINCD